MALERVHLEELYAKTVGRLKCYNKRASECLEDLQADTFDADGMFALFARYQQYCAVATNCEETLWCIEQRFVEEFGKEEQGEYDWVLQKKHRMAEFREMQYSLVNMARRRKNGIERCLKDQEAYFKHCDDYNEQVKSLVKKKQKCSEILEDVLRFGASLTPAFLLDKSEIFDDGSMHCNALFMALEGIGIDEVD